jgi:predicted transposase YdaD
VKAKTRAGTIIHIEIQIYLPDDDEMGKRIVFYDSKKEELAMLVQNSPQMQGAVDTLLEINQDAQARREFEYREKQRRDAVSREKRAMRESDHKARLEIARNMLKRKMPISDIMDITGLTATEMKEIQ